MYFLGIKSLTKPLQRPGKKKVLGDRKGLLGISQAH